MQNKIGYVLFILCVSLCASLLIIPIVRAEDHYADIQVTLQKDGTAQVTGISTESRFSTGVHDDYTSKKGSFWLLNLTSTTNLSDYFISLTFPENTEINYLKVSGRSRISAEDKLMIVTTGTDEPMNIVVQYRINSNTSSLLFLWVAIVIVVLIILGFFFWRYKKSRKNNEHNEHRKKVDEKENNEVRNKSGKKESEKSAITTVIFLKEIIDVVLCSIFI